MQCVSAGAAGWVQAAWVGGLYLATRGGPASARHQVGGAHVGHALDAAGDALGVRDLRLLVGIGGDHTYNDRANWVDLMVTCS